MEPPVTAPTVLSRPVGRWELPVVLALAFGLSLALTGGKVFDPAVEAKYSTNGDILEIAQGAESADAAAVRGWWTGGWIQQGSGYYRPMSSLLFLAEFRAWGRHFQPYFTVSWLCQALNTTLITLLAFRLFEARSRRNLVAAALAGVLFNLRHGPTGGPEWTGERLTLNLMPYWPAQTDLFALLFSLLALVALDQYLVRAREGARGAGIGWFGAALGLYVVALLFKEMAVSVPLLAASLAWYRADRSAGCRCRRVAGVLVAFALPAGLVLLLRHLWVPRVIEPSYRSGEYVGAKVAQYLSQPLTTYLGAGDYWLFVAIIGAAAAVWACLRYRLSIVWAALGVIAWCGVSAQLLGGNFALITIPMQLGRLGLVALFLAGATLLLTSRRTLLWMLASWVAFIHAPVLHVWGPHYLYWPAAFWALLNAALLDQALARAPAWAGRLRI